MLAKDTDTAVFRDLEKLYRVLGYYEGLEVKPLETHERHIDRSLDSHLRSPEEYIRRIQYEVQMSEALVDRRPVFKTDKPETSLLYSLFSEGIQSVIVLRDLAAVDIKDWAELIRKTLVDFDEGRSDKDLASVLWRSPSRNIRTKIYNALLDLEVELSARAQQTGERPKPTAAEIEEKQKAKEKGDSTESNDWHNRDHEWEVPDGAKVSRGEVKAKTVKPEAVIELEEKLQSVAHNPDLPNELVLSLKEVELLSEELSFFDQNHTDYNHLQWTLFQMQSSTSEATELARKYAEAQLEVLTQGIVVRFQPGLILLILDLMRSLDPEKFSKLNERLTKTITETLAQPANEKRLLASLKDPERARVTKKLLPFLDPKQFPAIVDFYLGTKDNEGLIEFLEIFLSRPLEHESLLFGWGEDRLVSVLPLFRRLSWPKKYEFLKRAVRSKALKLQRQACYYMINLQLDPDQALDLYKKMPDETREIRIQSLTEHPAAEHWKTFIRRLFQEGSWLTYQSESLKGKLWSAWIRIGGKYLGREVWRLTHPWIRARKLFLWPRHPEIREIALTTLIEDKHNRDDPEFIEACRAEARLPFQEEAIKRSMKALVSRSRGLS